MSADAQRRLGATSSATISTLDRLSPSWVSQLRCDSVPATTTRVPLVMDSATFSASERKHDVEEADFFLAVLLALVPGQPEAGDGHAALREPKLRIASHVARDAHVVVDTHGGTSGQPAPAGAASRGDHGGPLLGQTEQFVADDVVCETRLALGVGQTADSVTISHTT